MGGKIKGSLAYHNTKTVLGRRLSEIRSRIIASGESLLDWHDLEKEIVYRRDEKRGRTGSTRRCSPTSENTTCLPIVPPRKG